MCWSEGVWRADVVKEGIKTNRGPRARGKFPVEEEGTTLSRTFRLPQLPPSSTNITFTSHIQQQHDTVSKDLKNRIVALKENKTCSV